eukprot:gb/GECH01014245.1/.p1 GENE.gb/GECH01014245.1/~~gb/GECH01014245.1/.p1  ORF type:complete len:147 (+),score=36.36 gb/GECH01014245.1/:1-441(+)
MENNKINTKHINKKDNEEIEEEEEEEVCFGRPLKLIVLVQNSDEQNTSATTTEMEVKADRNGGGDEEGTTSVSTLNTSRHVKRQHEMTAAEEMWGEKLDELAECGYTNRRRCVRMLYRHDGDVTAVKERLEKCKHGRHGRGKRGRR